ncbi:MAG: hypothetical protein GEV10_21070 [Streptosporangiales bacterium]|nr:hypothetical protein [Streptosporangiales bacterium]
MADYMPLSRLLNLNFGLLLETGFDEAKEKAAGGLDSMVPIHNAIAGKQIWDGVGQPEASMVVQNNALAVDICRIQMESAARVVEGLHYALLNYAANLRQIVEKLRGMDCKVQEDGTVIPPDTTYGDTLVRETQAVRGTLKQATLADLDAMAALETIAGSTPELSDVADPGVAKYNQDLLDQSLTDADEFRSSADMWATSQSITLDQLENYTVDPADVEATLDTVIKGIRATGLNDHSLFDFLRGQWAEGQLGVIAEVFEAMAPKSTQAAIGKFLGAVGWLEFAGDIAITVFAPDPQTSAKVTVDMGRGHEAQVLDNDLQVIAMDYYADRPGLHDGREGSGSIADLAHYQIMTGESAGDVDWVEMAENRRHELENWLEAHGDDGDYQDIELARRMHEELEEALAHAPQA